MSRILENMQEKLIAEAQRLVQESGYDALTIRAVASGCGVGVGTVYNYFASKEDLLTACLLSQWQQHVDVFLEICAAAQTPFAALSCIYTQMQLFAGQYQPIFSSPEAVAAFGNPASPHNALLRKQIAQGIRPFCSSDFAAEFIAQAFLGSVMMGHSFEDGYSMLQKLF